MAFDDIFLNRQKEVPGLGERIAQNEPSHIFSAEEEGIKPRLTALEAAIATLQSQIEMLMKRINISSPQLDGNTPGAPNDVTLSNQTVVQDDTGKTWIEATFTWEGIADAFEIAWSRVEEF